MEHDNPEVMCSAFDLGQEGGTAESCEFCKALLDAAHQIVEKSRQKRDGKAVRERVEIPFVAELGRLDDIMVNSDCEEHKSFLRRVFHIREINAHARNATFEVRWYTTKGVAVLDMCYTDGGFQQEEFLLLGCQPQGPGLSCIERSRDEDYINIGLLKSWISSCEHYHTTSCCIPTKPSTSLSWMIDTIKCCLVPAGESARYVALSYVWGQTEMLRTTAKTLGYLQEAGALGENTCLKIPAVIRHAIALVHQLGERYLWVDTLCIPQDDPECLQRHIRHMASIYEAALFTLVAADGSDADHGIPGIRGVSPARLLPPSLRLTSRLRLRARGFLNILNSAWGFRGWTLQEHIFSKRKLVFVHGSVQWICQESRCFEDLCQEFPSIRRTRTKDQETFQELESVGDLALNYPKISQLETLLHHYSLRYLTYDNDVLNAVEAVFTAHRQAFPHGFLWGLPIDFFDMALLWSSNCGFSGLKRRQASALSSQSQFPSWTWAGWVGVVDSGQWRSATYIKDADEKLLYYRKKCLTIPMLEWRIRTTGSPEELSVPGQNSAYAYKQRFMGKKEGLPRGWRYEDETFGPECTNARWSDETYPSSNWALTTPYYYLHEAVPCVKFWHPVPIGPVATGTTAAPDDGRLLCAKTQIGRLWVVDAEKDMATGDGVLFLDERGTLMAHLFNDTFEVSTVFINAKGELVGNLHVDDADDRWLVEDHTCPANQAGSACELVAISKGNDFIQPMEPGKETYTFYNVLWIKWDNGIAYRRGVGRVKRETWESMELEDVDLVLG